MFSTLSGCREDWYLRHLTSNLKAYQRYPSCFKQLKCTWSKDSINQETLYMIFFYEMWTSRNEPNSVSLLFQRKGAYQYRYSLHIAPFITRYHSKWMLSEIQLATIVLTCFNFFPMEKFPWADSIGSEGVQSLVVKRKMLKVLIPSNLYVLEFVLFTPNTATRTPEMLPRDSMAVFKSLGGVTEFPSLT